MKAKLIKEKKSFIKDSKEICYWNVLAVLEDGKRIPVKAKYEADEKLLRYLVDEEKGER